MSELQIALIAIGALIILAVLVINWWQERRFHNQVETNFSPLRRDALLDDHDTNLTNLSQPQSFHELKFDISGTNGSSEDILDNRATDHFSIDETIVFNNQPIQPKYESSNRFVELPQENSNEVATQVKETIDETYKGLINSKLGRLSNQIPEANNKQALAQEVDDKQKDDFKAVFHEALTSQTQATSDLSTTKDLQDHLETSVSLPEMLDGQIDLTALLYLSNDTQVSVLNNALTSLFDNFDKLVLVHVFDSNKVWHLLKDVASNQESLNGLISKVACSIQLADRGGAIERSTLNRFQLAVETLGLDINGHVEWQNAGDALNAASSLDLFCLEVDKTIGIHLVHGESGAFTGTKLRGLAESQGLILSSDGTFKYFTQASDDRDFSKHSLIKPQLHPLFVMFNRDHHPFSPEMLRSSVVKSVTFQLDIPHVKQSAETFAQMIQVARQMEIGLNAVLVDDNNKVLGDIQVEKIRQQLKVLQASMLVRGIIPGSDSAHRLFS